jgi:hypothetical protein
VSKLFDSCGSERGIHEVENEDEGKKAIVMTRGMETIREVSTNLGRAGIPS